MFCSFRFYNAGDHVSVWAETSSATHARSTSATIGACRDTLTASTGNLGVLNSMSVTAHTAELTTLTRLRERVLCEEGGTPRGEVLNGEILEAEVPKAEVHGRGPVGRQAHRG